MFAWFISYRLKITEEKFFYDWLVHITFFFWWGGRVYSFLILRSWYTIYILAVVLISHNWFMTCLSVYSSLEYVP